MFTNKNQKHKHNINQKDYEKESNRSANYEHLLQRANLPTVNNRGLQGILY